MRCHVVGVCAHGNAAAQSVVSAASACSERHTLLQHGMGVEHDPDTRREHGSSLGN